MKKKILFLFFFVSTGLLLNAQTGHQSKLKYKIHYYVKESIYEALPNTRGEILFVGNSITASGQWTEMFQDLRVKNRGISGDVTDGILFRLKEITGSHPSKIFLMVGVNDLSKGKSKKYILEKYKEILDSIKSQTPLTKIYVQSILPVNDEFRYFKNHTNKTDSIISLNKNLKVLAIKERAAFIDLFKPFANSENKLKSEYTLDGLHLNGKGYLLWKSIVEKYVFDN
ncbi:GDSL-like Lipase/Acylhydrolase [bacterium BMS3Abin04]|nr:GDSL-like Lipase/Acylhydrolase [bacterium BMS3Abin04]